MPNPPASKSLIIGRPGSGAAPARAGIGARTSGPGARAAGEFDWHTYLAAVIRYKWLVLAVALAGTGAGIVGAMFVPPTYQAEATIWIETSRRNQGDPSPIWASQLMGQSGWVELVRSDLVLGHVVAAERLYVRTKNPKDAAALASGTLTQTGTDLVPGTYRFVVTDSGGRLYGLRDADGGGTIVDQVPFGAPLGTPLGFQWTPPEALWRAAEGPEFEIVSAYDAVRGVGENLRVRPDRDGSFMRLQLRGKSPEQLTRVVNGIAQRFVAVAADLKRERLTALVGILGGQLEVARRNLADRERVLKGFRERSATVLTAGDAPTTAGGTMARDPLFAAHFETRVTHAQLKADREAIERALRPGPDGVASLQSLELIGAVQRASALKTALEALTTKEAELRTLRVRYTDAHQLVRRLADDVAELQVRTIPGLARELAAELKTREDLLGREVASTSSELRRVSPLPVEDARLQRDVTIAEQSFAGLQQRYEEARLSEMSTIPDVRVLDGARVPSRPLSHLAPLIVLLGVLGGTGAGVGGAVVRQLLDRKVRIPEEVTGSLGMRILGVVPHVSRQAGQDETGPVVEALRVIRMNMLHAYGTAGPVVFAITSAGGSEGKSFIASNLALSFSGAGQRTLLIDADTRRGTLHRVVGGFRKPGLIDHLAGKVPIESLVQHTRYAGLDFIGCGVRTRTGPELLTSPAPARMLAQLRPQYDVIIVDSPPLAAGVDPYALATLTGNVLMVVRTGVTDRKLAEAKLDVLEQLPVRMLGAVLNDARMKGSGYEYLAYYMVGYELLDEEEDGRVSSSHVLRNVE